MFLSIALDVSKPDFSLVNATGGSSRAAKWTLSFKIAIGLVIASAAILSVLLTLSATGYSNTIPNLKSSSPSNHDTVVSPSDPSILPTYAPYIKTIKPTSMPARPTKPPYGAPSQAPAVPTFTVTSLPTATPTDVSSTWIFSYLHTSGNQIVDRNGNAVRISAVNW